MFVFFVMTAILSWTELSAQQHNIDSLRSKINSLKSSSTFTVKDTVYINLLNKLGDEFRYYKTDSLYYLSLKAKTYSNEINYSNGYCRAIIGIGNFYSDKGNSELAIKNFREAQVLANKLSNFNLELQIQNNLGSEYSYAGDYALALEIFLKGIEKAEDLKDLKMLSIMNENIADLYVKQKDYNNALDFYKKVKKINESLRNEVSSAETLSNMASLYADMGELDYAMFNINTSISVFERLQIIDWLAYAYEIKGKTYLKQKKYKWALHWYSQSEMLHEKLDDTRGEISLLNGMAQAYLGSMQDSLSESYALKAYEYSTAINFKEGIEQCAETLYILSKNKGDFTTALKYHEIYQGVSDMLSRSENKKSLTMLKTQVDYERQKAEWNLSNERSLAKQRNYIYIAVVILLIFLAVTILIKRSEKIQRGLNTELNIKQNHLEIRESELSEINATKDKLFSIIGHDLRGPIGAFQGLLKLFRDGEMNQEEFLEFIPKLRNDIDNISFTLNNLLSWGQSQMNGLITKPSVISVDTLVNENIKLLSEIAENKSIQMISRLPPNTMAWSDGDQIDIVIRNLISNALKFTPESGIITIEAIEKTDYWEISIRDTGIGIDDETKKIIFEENSTVTTYGTNNEKGTGLGLSLCKEMIEKNNGTIWVESILNKGTSFYFTLTKSKKAVPKTYSKAS
ncbi:tetratricopeptide repeat-containing sensor histidine kinase [Aurantibacter crassamenti]|uniref:tetratricopeptide repeat-containing sensor histidine kinase n=1 Tax=Aurantibacter crassamenti TaxID=1837375 RepID=UPI001EEE4E3C|nr:tetratricopeptide repeat-containing sensor histidine kinase [Aurantibacter crassamenti]